MLNCVKAMTTPVKDNNDQQLIKDSCLVYTLRRVGCRVYKTQDELADLY